MTKQLFIALLTFLIIACSPLKKIKTTKSGAEIAYQNKNYQEALFKYQQLIGMYEAAETAIGADIYLKVATSAFELSQYDLAKEFYIKAMDHGKQLEALVGLKAICLVQSDIEAMKAFITAYENKLEENDLLLEVQGQLFDLFVKHDKYDEAYSMIDQFNIESIMPRLTEFLLVLEKLEKEKEAVKWCQKVLEQDEKNEHALSWMAMYDYHRAEKWYKAEMATYNKNKNATTYAYLRRDLKKISAIFRVAKERFEALHQIDPDNRQYMKYLKNCYLRLEMKKEAASMDQLLDQ
jgi:hypothetical protein